MDSKPWYLSKTIWSDVVTIVFSILAVLGQITGHVVIVPAWVYTLLAAIGIYGRASADTHIG